MSENQPEQPNSDDAFITAIVNQAMPQLAAAMSVEDAANVVGSAVLTGIKGERTRVVELLRKMSRASEAQGEKAAAAGNVALAAQCSIGAQLAEHLATEVEKDPVGPPACEVCRGTKLVQSSIVMAGGRVRMPCPKCSKGGAAAEAS